jgi:hypothetical protein
VVIVTTARNFMKKSKKVTLRRGRSQAQETAKIAIGKGVKIAGNGQTEKCAVGRVKFLQIEQRHAPYYVKENPKTVKRSAGELSVIMDTSAFLARLSSRPWTSNTVPGPKCHRIRAARSVVSG